MNREQRRHFEKLNSKAKLPCAYLHPEKARKQVDKFLK